MPRNHFFLAKMARFRLRIFQGSNIPRTQASYMPRTWDAWCWKPIFRENVPKTSIFTRLGSRRGTRKRINTIKRIKRINRKWTQARQNRAWVPHAGERDDGSLHKLPQISEDPGCRSRKIFKNIEKTVWGSKNYFKKYKTIGFTCIGQGF